MVHLSRSHLLAFVVATLVGTCLHFVYSLLPNPFTALFSPVNESLWEHLKLLYWPGLVAGLVLMRKEHDSLGPRAAVLLFAAVAMLAVGYVYHVVFQGDALWFDIALYVLLMAAIIFLPSLLGQDIWQRQKELLLLLTAALGVAIVLFTFLPPDGILFQDLSGAPTWATIPY